MVGDGILAVNEFCAKKHTVEQKTQYLLDCIRQNWHIFPLHTMREHAGRLICSCRAGEACPCPGKHPLGRWSIPIDPTSRRAEDVVRAHMGACPEQGWGLHLGLSGLMVLDVDPRNGGNESLELLCSDLGWQLPEPTVQTGGGGRHYYFRAAEGSDPRRGWGVGSSPPRTSIIVSPGIELLCGQHYVVLPYSPHRSGGQYVCRGETADAGLLAPLLSFLQERERDRAAEALPCDPVSVPAGCPVLGAGPAGVSVGAPAARARAWLAKRSPAISGQGGRAHTSATAAKLVIDFALPIEDAYQLLLAWNQTCVPPWPASQLQEIVEWAAARPGDRGRALHERDSPVLAIPPMKGEGQGTGPAERAVGPAPTPSAPKTGNAAQRGPHAASFRCGPPLPAGESSPGMPGQRPPAETRPPASSGKISRGEHCNCWWSALFREKQGSGFAILRLRGKRWNCPECGPARRKRMLDSMRHRFIQYAEPRGGLDAVTLYLAEIPWSDWKWIGHRLRAVKGLQLHIAWQATGKNRGQTCLCIATVPVAGADWQAMSGTEAIARCREIVCDLSDTIHTRVYWSSRLWRLLPLREASESTWASCGPVFASWPSIQAILHGLMIRTVPLTIDCPYYGSWGLRGACDAEMWEEVRACLTHAARMTPHEEETIIETRARDLESVQVPCPFDTA